MSARWRCLVCGYEHDGEAAPATCPVCGAEADAFAAAQPVVLAGAALSGFAGRVVVIGAGAAGVSAAAAARRSAPAAGITIVDGEADAPYLRLNLTRFLAGTLHRDDLGATLADGIARPDGRRVVAIDRAASAVRLDDGSRLGYDALVLACGAQPVRPEWLPAGLEGVFCLRTLAEAEAILDRARPGTRVLVAGGGLLGLEVAGALAGRGCAVQVLERGRHLLSRQLDAEAGACLDGHLRAAGVGVQYTSAIAACQGAGRISGVILTDGRVLPCDLLVVALGVRPDAALARAAGLACGAQGVRVDDRLATSDPRIFAAGDCVEHASGPGGLWSVAETQGGVAGANAVGGAQSYHPHPPTVRLKVLSVDVVAIGPAEPAPGDLVLRDVPRPGVSRRLLLRDGRLVGALLVGDGHGASALAQAIAAGTPAPAGDLSSIITALAGPGPGPVPTEHPMPSLKGTQTEKNLIKAFAGESQARNRYTYFAGAARKEGLVQIAAIFEETANQEKEHAKRFFSFLEGGMCEITACFPAGKVGTTAENLAAAAGGEHEEWGELYPNFAAVAKQEGFAAVAVVFEKIAIAEKHHEERYRGLLANLQAGTVFKKAKPVTWNCRNCGYTHEGAEAPKNCPACAHPQEHFEVKAANW